MNHKFKEKYDRLEKVLNFKQVDHFPYADWVQNQEVIEYYSYESDKENYWTVEQTHMMADACMGLIQEFTPSFVPDKYYPTPQDIYGIFAGEDYDPDLKVKEYKENSWVAEDREGFVWEYNYWTRWIIDRPFNDYKGAVRYLADKAEEIDEFRLGIDWEEYGERFAQNKEYNIIQSSTPQLYMTPLGGLGLDSLYPPIGWEYLSRILYSEDKNILKKYLNACTKLSLDWINNVVKKEYSPIALIYSDIASKTGPLISPDHIEELLAENINKLTSAYHEKGIKVIYHSEGNLRKVLDILIESGINGINPLEWYSDMEIIKVRKEYPGLILYGGIDDSNLLRNGSLAEVENYIKNVINEIGKDSGLLLGSSGEIHPACRKENVIKMIDTINNTEV